MISMMTWAIVPLLAAAQTATSTPAPASCPVTIPVKADAPRDPNADPIRAGYWHISADRLVWAPAAAPGTVPTFVGRYWVRPAGAALVFIARRLDLPGSPIISTERDGYPTDFYFGSVDVPADGCWEITARTGASSVTFVTEIRHPIERFAVEPATRVTWSKEIGRITDGAAELVVTAVTLEDPKSPTRRLRGTRIDVTDGIVSDQFWQEELQSTAMRQRIAQWAAGDPMKIYGLSGAYAVNNRTGLSIDTDKPKYQFRGADKVAELARLLLQALDALKALVP